MSDAFGLQVGCAARLVGLRARPDYEGRIVIIKKLLNLEPCRDSSTCSHADVEMQGGGESLRVRIERLVAMDKRRKRSEQQDGVVLICDSGSDSEDVPKQASTKRARCNMEGNCATSSPCVGRASAQVVDLCDDSEEDDAASKQKSSNAQASKQARQEAADSSLARRIAEEEHQHYSGGGSARGFGHGHASGLVSSGVGGGANVRVRLEEEEEEEDSEEKEEYDESKDIIARERRTLEEVTKKNQNRWSLLILAPYFVSRFSQIWRRF